MSTLKKAAQIIRIAASYYVSSDEQAKELNDVAAELERMDGAEPAGWRVPAFDGVTWHFNPGKPSDLDIAYWRKEGVELELVYTTPPEAKAQIDALKAERNELREVLEVIANDSTVTGTGKRAYAAAELMRIAALQETKP